MLTALTESSIQIIETQTQRIKTMAGLVCTQCECPTDEGAYPLCEDCQTRLEALLEELSDKIAAEEAAEDEGPSYYEETDEHRTY